MQKKKRGEWTETYIQNQINKYLSMEPKKPYVGFLIYILNQKLKKISYLSENYYKSLLFNFEEQGLFFYLRQ
jgi:hypothetical protein